MGQVLTKGRTTIYDQQGGFEEANRIFDLLDLSNIRELTNSNFNGRIGDLDDGRTVIVRDGSRGTTGETGPPTLEIQQGKRTTKYRFFE